MERKMTLKPKNKKNTSKGASISNHTSPGLGIVLSGILTDNIGLGRMIGVVVGLCGGSATGALKGKKKEANDE